MNTLCGFAKKYNEIKWRLDLMEHASNGTRSCQDLDSQTRGELAEGSYREITAILDAFVEAEIIKRDNWRTASSELKYRYEEGKRVIFQGEKTAGQAPSEEIPTETSNEYPF